VTVYQIHYELDPFIWIGNGEVFFKDAVEIQSAAYKFQYVDIGIPTGNSLLPPLKEIEVIFSGCFIAPNSIFHANLHHYYTYEIRNTNFTNGYRLVTDIYLSTEEDLDPLNPGTTIQLANHKPFSAEKTPTVCDCPLPILLSQGCQQPLLHT
jgi:hypothetical protein